MKIFLFYSLFLSSSLFGFSHPLKKNLERSQEGDYIVTEINKTITLLCIRSISSDSLTIEEISAPKETLKHLPASWSEWVKEKAPGHSSWGVMEINLQNGEIAHYYSFSRSSWIQLSSKESVMATLLQLPFIRLPEEKIRKIGPPPMEGEPDIRQRWNPPLIFEGKKIARSSFDIFEVVWPEDGSELSGRDVTIYFDKDKRVSLPYWIQAETSHFTGAIRTIDSGKNLPVVYKYLPPKRDLARTSK